MVLVADSAVADALGAGLQAVGVRSEVGDVSPALELLESLKGALAPDPIPPYFSAYSEGEVKAFFKAARAFFRAKPWERLGGTKFIAFRLADGPWHYANVMGQEGEAFGLATFGDWLEVCRTLNNVETLWERLSGLNQAETLPKSFLAAGGAESLSLCSLAELAPEDVTFLAELGVKPDRRQQLPAVQRFTPAGAAAPTLAPAS